MDPVELILMVFDGGGRADEVFKQLKHLERQKQLRLFDVAVLVKDRNGKTHLMETRDLDARRGALVGAIVGGLVGMLGGPAGAVLGAAAGAATGGVTAGKIDLGFSNDFLEEIRACLKPDNSAILVIVEQTWIDRVVGELEAYQGELFRHALRAEIAAQLAKYYGE
jgi:uncharacterized membrane protein